MKVITVLRNLKLRLRDSTVTIGAFDGVHIGHRRIIKSAVNDARKNRRNSVVVTFDPHPSRVVGRNGKVPSLISLAHRIRLIEALGADYLVILKFTKSLSKMAPEKFLKTVLLNKLKTKHIYIGKNFYFGKGGSAGVEDLRRLSKAFGYALSVVKPEKVGGILVSSSLIRNAILKGNLDHAQTLLGRPVSMLGTVVSGTGLARYLGYPTANVNPHHEVIPPTGVYAVRVAAAGRLYKGVLNIGVRPTLFAPKDREPSIEAHIFDFKGNLYGKDVEIYFVAKIREEEKFDTVADLVAQIKSDEKTARDILGKPFTKYT